jgi:DNA-binding GntR family transcriptional regulator
MRSEPPLRVQAYQKFVNALVERNLHPGQVVTQRELVELTGFPLGAVRELIPRLEGDGLLITLNRRGLQIAPVDVNLVRNAYQLRLILEKEALAVFIAGAPVDEISAIEDQHREFLETIAAGSVSQAIADKAQEVDWGFHEAIIESMRNAIVSDIYRVNSIKIRLTYQARLRLTAHNLKRVMTEHLAVIGAIKRRDQGAAIAALTDHIEASRSLALGESPGGHGLHLR